MKTVAELKRAIRVGTMLTSTYHLQSTGTWDDNGNAICQDKYLGIREVTIVLSTQFGVKTLHVGSGKYVTSWMNWPKTKEVRFNDDGSFTILTDDARNGAAPDAMVPVITYGFAPAGSSQVEFNPGTTAATV